MISKDFHPPMKKLPAPYLPLIAATAWLALPCAPSARAAEWQQATGPLKTRWAKQVSPENALPEYPRPQMVRKDWQNLNGLWDIKLGDGTETQILVPYPIESALSGVMKHSDRMTYRRSFAVPKDWSGRKVLLHFGAVDWETQVSVNGKEIGIHRGGYDPFSFEISAALKPEGPQEITVQVFDPTNDGGKPRGKQSLIPGSIMYTPTSGIWQTVWLEPVAESHIESLKLVPDLDAGCLRLTVNGSGTVEAIASDGGKQVAQISGAAGSELIMPIPNPKLWAPGSPHLYDLQVSLKSDGKVVDAVTSYFGMRKIALGKDEKGITRMMLNGKFVFQVGPLDQGFWPDGLYTAPTDAALRFDITETLRLGFNCTRKHIKVEPQRWYHWLAMTRKLDPSRLINNASGDTDKNCGDVIDKHSYPGPESPKPEENRAAVLGEFGGLGLPLEGHTWSKKTWGYKDASSMESLTRGYEKLLAKSWELNKDPGLSAVIYTQITDVETECNGLLTYDRAIHKVIPDFQELT